MNLQHRPSKTMAFKGEEEEEEPEEEEEERVRRLTNEELDFLFSVTVAYYRLIYITFFPICATIYATCPGLHLHPPFMAEFWLLLGFFFFGTFVMDMLSYPEELIADYEKNELSPTHVYIFGIYIFRCLEKSRVPPLRTQSLLTRPFLPLHSSSP